MIETGGKTTRSVKKNEKYFINNFINRIRDKFVMIIR